MALCLVTFGGIVFCSTSEQSADAPRVAAGPSLLLEVTEVDFGRIEPTDRPARTVRVTNTGPRPVTLQAARSSCGCTRAILDKQRLAPGESAGLRIELDVSDYPSNTVRSIVHVESDGTPHAMAQLSVVASISPEYALAPERVEFGKVKRDARPEVCVKLRQTGGLDVVIERIEAPAGLIVSYADSTGQLGAEGTTGGDENPKVFNVTVQLQPEFMNGIVNSRFAIITNVARMPRIEVPVSAEVVGVECSVSPKVVVFGASAAGERIGAVTVRGTNDIQVLEAQSSDPSIEAEIVEVLARKEYLVALRLGDAPAPGKRAGKIVLKLKEGAILETREVPFFGSVGQK